MVQKELSSTFRTKTIRLSQTTSLTLGFHQHQDVVLSDWTLDVSDNGTGGVVQEFNTDLSDTTTRAGTA